MTPRPETGRLSPEQQVDAVKAALAEDGYPNARIYWNGLFNEAGEPTITFDYGTAPLEALWRATACVAAASGRRLVCWPCWDGKLLGCTHDWRTAPWPPVARPVGSTPRKEDA